LKKEESASIIKKGGVLLVRLKKGTAIQRGGKLYAMMKKGIRGQGEKGIQRQIKKKKNQQSHTYEKKNKKVWKKRNYTWANLR